MSKYKYLFILIISFTSQVTHTWSNKTLRRKEDHDDHEQMRACFYRGSVFADPRSTVSVTLCNGMVS